MQTLLHYMQSIEVPPALRIKGLSHAFGEKKVLYDVNLEIKAGQIVALIGPSGCGKTTLLYSILGTQPPNKGQIFANGIPVCGPSKNVGIVYQNYALYDFMTARENVAFGLKLDQTSIPGRICKPLAWRKLRKQHLQEADAMLEKVGLLSSADCYPSQLSGGMKQRAAIAQALIMAPSILLMDEPFGALDEATRESLQMMLISLYQENVNAKKAGKKPPHTILIVTHELNEALYVSDRVIGLSQYHVDGDKGSTILYDQPSPVFRPNDPKDFTRFAKQKEDVRNIVFSPDRKERAKEWIRLWNETIDHCLPGDDKLSPDRI